MTREEILAVYESGPEAVVVLVQTLLHSHEQQIVALNARITELEDRLSKDSHNSHKPPSSDGLAKKTKKKKSSLRRKSGKKSGGQPGHPGATLDLVDHPDHIIDYRPTNCSGCGTCLCKIPTTSSGFERRQVHEAPPLKLVVTEHRAFGKVCPACKSTTSGTFPEGVSSRVQYGERLKAIGVYLQEYQLLPFSRTHEVLFDLFGSAPSEGTLAHARARCHERLEPIEAAIKQAISKAGVVNFDETGMRIETKTHWIHHAGTESLTYYAHHQKRGREALEAIGILSEFRGVSVHDCYASYFTYDENCSHALCNAHLLRELIAVYEQDAKQQQPQQQEWSGRMIELLMEIKSAVEQAREANQRQLRVGQREDFERRYGKLVAEGMKANPPPPPKPGKKGRTKQSTAKNLLDRLEKYREAVLRFMEDFRVPFDNNLSERDLRMVKVQQKISGCFRSKQGASQFCRIRGYISTLRKQSYEVLSALQSVFAGKPYMPRLQT